MHILFLKMLYVHHKFLHFLEEKGHLVFLVLILVPLVAVMYLLHLLLFLLPVFDEYLHFSLQDDEQIFTIVAFFEDHIALIAETEFQFLGYRDQLLLGQLLLEPKEVKIEEQRYDVLFYLLQIVIGRVILVTLQHSNQLL